MKNYDPFDDVRIGLTGIYLREEKDMQEIYKLVSIKDIANDLAISSKTLYQKVQKNEIPYHRMGRTIRFKRSDIKIWLDNNCPDLETMKRKGLF